MFNPRSVAVIGASSILGKWGYNILSMLLAKGGREVYAVNKRESEIQGLKTYPSIQDVTAIVDFAIITVPLRDVPLAMEDCVKKDVKAALIITGGLAETGGEGAKLERVIVDIARKAGIRFIGPNCMGHFNIHSNFLRFRLAPH